MMITADQLRAFCPRLQQQRAEVFADALSRAAEIAELSIPILVRHFMAQVAQETGGLSSLVESTSYKDAARLDALFTNVQGRAHAERLIAAGKEAIGNTIYANKNGNGGVDSGDGYRYRGRGFLQVTGRANYREIGKLANLPLDDQPDLLGEPEPAARAAAWFWVSRKINTAARANEIKIVTKLVNGPKALHLNERKDWLRVAQSVWHD